MTKHTTYSKQEKQVFKDLCKVLINSKIDCRRFINIKLIFLEHENLKDGKLPLDDFKHLLNKTMKRETLTDYVEQQILKTILLDPKDDFIDYVKLCKFLDYYTYIYLQDYNANHSLHDYYNPLNGLLEKRMGQTIKKSYEISDEKLN